MLVNKVVLSILLIASSSEVYNILDWIQKEGLFQFDIKHIQQDKAKAEQCISEKHPDLIILEISNEFSIWKFMDEVQTKEKNAEILLTSQEKSFEYAYQAFQHRAIDFLLEPIDKKAILRCLEEVAEKKRMIYEMNEDKKKLDLYELKQHQDLMEKILRNMLEKPEELELLIGEVNQRYQTTLINDNFLALVINTDKQELYYEKTGFCQKVINLIENTFSHSHEVFGAVMEPYGITGIVNISSRFSLDSVKDAIQDLYYNILVLREEHGEFSISIGVGTVVHTMKEVDISLQEAFRAEQYKLVSKESRIFYASHIPQKVDNLEHFITISLKKNFWRLLRNMNEEGLAQWFSEIIELSEQSFQSFPEGYFLLKNLILQMAKEAWDDKMAEEYFLEEEIAVRNLEHLFVGKRILERLEEIILRICQKRKRTQTVAISQPIQVAVAYICQHYSEAITLEELADVCGLSPNYFSAIFKEQIGVTYIDYLTEWRLEQALQQLAITKKNVKEIANEIGYLDDKYFRKLFKNRFGITPLEYRNKNKSVNFTKK